MHPVIALFAPDRDIERRERQTRPGIHRPDDGDPTHGNTAAYYPAKSLPLSTSVFRGRSCKKTSESDSTACVRRGAQGTAHPTDARSFSFQIGHVTACPERSRVGARAARHRGDLRRKY
jgi:hypothetical protein